MKPGMVLLSVPALFLMAQSGAAITPPVLTTDDFCVRVQHLLAETDLVPARNVVHGDYAAFKRSKVAVRPLETHQYVLRAPDGSEAPLRVSCKVKTADHLNAEYGAGTAGAGGPTCRDINRDTARRVHARLLAEDPDRIRIPPERLVFTPDSVHYTGSGWTADHAFVYPGAGGRIHVEARALRVDWDNLWFAWAPNQLRGVYYCHLVAPEYLRRIMLGEVDVAAG